MDKRLKHYEALLREKGIDPCQVTGASEAELHSKRCRSEVPETVRRLLIPASAVSEPQATIFKPQLLHGQRGTKLVDK